MKIKLILIMLSAFLLIFSTFVNAEERIALDIRSIQSEITPDQTATYTLKIHNFDSFAKTLIFVPKDKRFTITFEPAYDLVNGIELEANGEKTTKILVKPIENLAPGIYYVDFTLQDRVTSEVYSTNMILTLRPKTLTYPINVSIQVDFLKRFVPTKPASAILTITNNNAKEYGEVKLDLSSKFLNQVINDSLGPSEIKTYHFPVVIEKSTPPQPDSLNVKLWWNNSVIAETRFDYDIVATQDVFLKNITTQNKFLQSITVLKVTNPNNIQDKEIILMKKPKLMMLFSSEPEYKIAREGKKEYLQFSITLDPNQSTEIILRYDYRVPVLILFVLLIILILVYANASPLTIKKTVEDVKTSEDMITSFKVILTLRNRKNKPIENLKIYERIINLCHFVKGDSHEVFKITNTIKEGTVVEYHIASLEPKEERVVAYHVKSKLKIIGGIRLKPSVVKFKYAGKDHKITSNELELRV